MADIVFLIVLAIWSALIGRAILSKLNALPAHPVDAFGISVPLGLGVLALSALGLGEFNGLNRLGFTTVFTLGLIGSLLVKNRPGIVRQSADWKPPRSWFDVGFAVCLMMTCLGTFFTSLAPVTDGDALCYHLQVPKRFLVARSMIFDPDLHETIYPLVTEMLYAIALAFRGPVACRLVQWLLGLCLAANVTALARPILGKRAWWAGTITLLVPAVSNGMSAPLNDVALAAFGNAALAAVLMWRDQPSLGKAIAAGILAGLAVGVKYPALVWTGLLGFGFLPQLSVGPEENALKAASGTRDQRQPSRLLSFVAFALSAILIGGGWYLRAYVCTGNPVYPFFRHFFGGSGIDDVLDPIKRPMPVTLWNLLTALGPITLDPDRFDSFSHQFGPVFLLFAPGLFVLRPPRRITAIAAVGFAFLVVCLTQRQSMRFVLIAIGPFSVAAAWIASEWLRRGSRSARLLVGMLLMIGVFESLISIGRVRHGLPVILGRESTDSFLTRREPTYRVGRWIDAHLPVNSRLIGQEHRGYYLPCEYTMELAHRRRTGLGTRGETPIEIVEQLRRDGFTHLLTCPPEPETAVEFDGLLSRKLSSWLASRIPLYEAAIIDPDGVTRRYRIDTLAESAEKLVTKRAAR